MICGGGIAGLAAAWEAVQHGITSICVLDQSVEMGGKLRTSEVGGELVDEGADAFLIRVPAAIELCGELGIAEDLIHPDAGTAELWKDGVRHAFPSGLTLGVPTTADLIDNCAFLDAGAPVAVNAERAGGHEPLNTDVSIGAFMRSHFGDSIADMLIEPLIGGINAGRIDALSMDAVVPQLADAARASGSLACELERRAKLAPPTAGEPIFATTPKGISGLITPLVSALRRAGVDLRTSTDVTALRRSDDGIVVSFQDIDSGERSELAADGAVLAVGAPRAAAITSQYPSVSAQFSAISTASVVVVVAVFDDLDIELDAAGVLIPRTDASTHVTAISYGSTKWRRLAERGRVVFRVSLGYDGHDECIDWSDEDLIAAARAELHRILDISLPPTATRVSRWPNGFTQYAPGHLDRMATLDRALETTFGPVRIAGSAFHGIGIPSSIDSGRRAVRSLM